MASQIDSYVFIDNKLVAKRNIVSQRYNAIGFIRQACHIRQRAKRQQGRYHYEREEDGEN